MMFSGGCQDKLALTAHLEASHCPYENFTRTPVQLAVARNLCQVKFGGSHDMLYQNQRNHFTRNRPTTSHFERQLGTPPPPPPPVLGQSQAWESGQWLLEKPFVAHQNFCMTPKRRHQTVSTVPCALTFSERSRATALRSLRAWRLVRKPPGAVRVKRCFCLPR